MVLWYYSMLLILLCQLNMKNPAVYTFFVLVCVCECHSEKKTTNPIEVAALI